MRRTTVFPLRLPVHIGLARRRTYPLTLCSTLTTAGASSDAPPLLLGRARSCNRPGEGGNAGGAVNDRSKLGVRWTTTGTAYVTFMGRDHNLMMGSQNPARDYTGTCGGDSGGPIFHDDGGVELQVAITSSGDAICRGSAIMARTDTPQIQAFLGCVQAAPTVEEIGLCGCTEVDSQGECPTP